MSGARTLALAIMDAVLDTIEDHDPTIAEAIRTNSDLYYEATEKVEETIEGYL